MISYGPCQTPTLTFTVQRHQVITAFQPEDFWSVRPHISKAGQRYDLLLYFATSCCIMYTASSDVQWCALLFN